jgi:hypothetical protein
LVAVQNWSTSRNTDKMSKPSVDRGAIAQLGERIVRNDEVVGSSPTSSTISFNNPQTPIFRFTFQSVPIQFTSVAGCIRSLSMFIVRATAIL